MGEYRIERDSMGEMQVPADALYGASTARAVINFPISGQRFPRAFLWALGLIKKAAAETNAELGLLDPRLAAAIAQAAQEVADGRWDDHFPVDIFQTGSGTSTNMNANEVIANRAAEILGQSRGSRAVHPNDHVNMGQSSNDVIPTALHIAALAGIEQHLMPALDRLAGALAEKAQAWDGIVKIGRTHLMDATPIRLGQEFSGYAAMVRGYVAALAAVREPLAQLALGGTAVGTGLNTHPEFARRAIARLAQWTGLPLREAANHFACQGGMDAAALASGALKAAAAGLMKIANDIRWLGSGPRCSLGELALPAVQPGSSIMPGKVNPVIAESLIMVCAQVQANDLAVTIGSAWGNFELNAMLPLIARNLLESISLLARAVDNFTERLVRGLEANRERCTALVEQSLAMVTALAPVIGYDQAAEIAKQAWQTGKTVRELLLVQQVLPPAEVERILDPWRMTEPGIVTGTSVGG